MAFAIEVPPTAGLPARFGDFLPRSGFGKAKQHLTDRLAAQFDLPPLQLECSGTACLIIALKTLQAMPENAGRDEVVVPAYNCPLIVLAVAHCGLKLRLCDTMPGSFDFDPAALQDCVHAGTLAIMPTHLGGQAANIAAVKPLARKIGAWIIEDAAQSLGAPQLPGGGDIIFFSLAVGKGLTLYEGGLLTAKTAKMRAALQAVSCALIPSLPFFELQRLVQFCLYACFYRPSLLPLVYGRPRRRALAKGQLEEAVGDIFSTNIPLHKVSNLRAGFGLAAALRLPDFLQAIRAQARRRLPVLQKLAEKTGGKLQILGTNKVDKAVWPFFMLLMPDKASRDAALAQLWPSADGVSRLFIHALGDYAYLQSFLGAQPATPNARNLAERMLTVSNSLWLANGRFEKLCHIIEQALLAGDKKDNDIYLPQ